MIFLIYEYIGMLLYEGPKIRLAGETRERGPE